MPDEVVVVVEPAELDIGVATVFKEYGRRRVRLAFDPARVSEPTALSLLRAHLPRLSGCSLAVVHHVGT